jgi:uncharacterized protein (TIGR03663 family)
MTDFKTTYPSKKQNVLWMGLIVIFLAIVSRLYMLNEKPLHFDEGINGWFSMKMTEMGFYKYDPENYHGPLYFYLLHWTEGVLGVNSLTLRLVPTLFGIASVVALVLAGWGRQIFFLWFALFLLLSPAFIFFSRSGIHEIPFVFFQLIWALGFTDWIKRPSRGALLFFLTGLWGLLVLKETFSISILAFFISVLLMGPTFWRRCFSIHTLKHFFDRTTWKYVTFLTVLFVLLFTGFLYNMSGIFDFFKAMIPWLKTGTHGNGHQKEFLYWMNVMLKAEPLVLLCFVAAILGLFQQKSTELRFWSFFALLQFLVYSLIPYKTIWCIVSIIWPFYLVGAISIQNMIAGKRKLLLLFFFLLVAAVCVFFGLRSSWLSSYRHPIDMDHPYVYVNSTYLAKQVQEFLQLQVHARPEIKAELIQMGMTEQWPWPWVLRDYDQVSYQLCSKEILLNAMVYLCESAESVYFERSFKEPYWKLKGSLRQTRSDSVIYFKKSIFPELPFFGAELIEN